MDRESALEIVRRAYAKQTMAAAGVADRRVEAAFAAVKREHFLGRGPWPIRRWGRGYETSPSRDPVYLYDACGAYRRRRRLFHSHSSPSRR